MTPRMIRALAAFAALALPTAAMADIYLCNHTSKPVKFMTASTSTLLNLSAAYRVSGPYNIASGACPRIVWADEAYAHAYLKIAVREDGGLVVLDQDNIFWRTNARFQRSGAYFCVNLIGTTDEKGLSAPVPRPDGCGENRMDMFFDFLARYQAGALPTYIQIYDAAPRGEPSATGLGLCSSDYCE